MIGKDDSMKILEKVISFAKNYDVMATIGAQDLSLTRYYENHIHQNLRRHDHRLSVRIYKGKKAGSASVNLLDDGSLRWAVRSAIENLEVSREDKDYPGLARPEPFMETSSYVPATANLDPKDRAIACGVVIEAAARAGCTASGTYSSSVEETVIATSSGVRAYNIGTKAFFRAIVNDGPNTGYADRLTKDTREIDYSAVAEEAVSKATMSEKLVRLEPGRYDTIFEEYAFSDLIRFLGFYSFGADGKQDGRSFMSRRMGEKVMSEDITIWDDGTDPRGFAIPFDAEGTPKSKVTFIDKGVAKGVVYDRRTAAKDGVKSTGHAGGRGGPRPGNMLVGTGTVPKEKMIEETEKGLLVTRFHYTHCPDPFNVVATGTTRDGTFLIKDGQIAARVTNLRFTESVVEALGRVMGISPTSRLCRDWWSSFDSVLPHIKIAGFNFTGSTTF